MHKYNKKVIKNFLVEEEEEREELTELYAEAKMPIEDIILKYKNKILENVDKNKESVDEPSSSKESISKPKSIG